MIYFLDFDWTLFDNGAYQKYLVAIPELAFMRPRIERIFSTGRGTTITGGEERLAMWDELETLFSTGAFTFDAGRIKSFVFPYARDFLERHGTESVIVTNVLPRFVMHKAKVELSGCAALVRDVVYCVGHRPKGKIIMELTRKYEPPYTFVDDLEVNLKSVQEAVPQCSVYQSLVDIQ